MRKSLWFTVLAILGLIAAGCGDDGDSEAEPAPEAGADGAATEEPAALEEFSVGVFPGAFHSLVQHVALEEGFFEDHGLDMELIITPSGPEAIAALSSNSIEVMINSPGNQLLANAQGQDIVGILGAQHTALYTWVAQQDWPTPNEGRGYPAVVEDLRGATVGVTARGAETELFTSAFLADAGLDPARDVTYVGVGIGPSAIGAFKAKQIDVLVAVEPSQTLLVDVEGVGKTMLDLRGDEGPERFVSWPSLTLEALRSDVEANPELFTSYQAAVIDAFEFMKDEANKDRVVEIYAEVLDFEPSTLELIYDNNIDTIGPSFDCEAYEAKVPPFMIESGQLAEADAQTCAQLMWDGGEAYLENAAG